MTIKEGLCIGGPLAGKRLTHRGNIYCIPLYDYPYSALSCMGTSPEKTVPVQYAIYKYHPCLLAINNRLISAWLYQTIGTVEEAVLEILRDYGRSR